MFLFFFFLFFFFFLRFYLFLERGKGEREKHQCVVASCTLPTGDLARNRGVCPNWELNRRPFASPSYTQPTEPHRPGQECFFSKNVSPLPPGQSPKLLTSSLEVSFLSALFRTQG